MSKKVTIRGAAPQIALLTLLYLLISVITSYLTKPTFRIDSENFHLIVFGIVWVIPGLIMVSITGRMITKSFKENKLLRTGLYRIIRNPMYAAYFLFIIPGICLLFNSWLVLTTIPVNYFLIQIFIQKEYNYLRQKYGKEYDEYLKTVLIKFL